MLKNELATSTTSGIGDQSVPYWKAVLAKNQRWLYDDYDWPFLRVRNRVTLIAGTRYYDLPAVDFERIERVRAQQSGGKWVDVDYGIGEAEFNSLDSEAGITADPVAKWYYYGTDQFEVWPIPASEGIIQFTGISDLPDLLVDGDAAALDDQLIVLYSAAEVATKNGETGFAQSKLAQAQARFNRLKGQNNKGCRTFTMGGGIEVPQESGQILITARVEVPTSEVDTTRVTGRYAIPNGVDSGSVTFALHRTPQQLLSLEVIKPSGGFNIQANYVSGTLSTTGFSFTLDGITDSTGYTLVYDLSYNAPDVDN